MAWLVQATAGTEASSLEVMEPEIQVHTLSTSSDAANDWLCACCHNRVASEKDRFAFEGRSEFLFKNPEGVRFPIMTFPRTLGCRERGVPTLEHTWFSGHAWSYCLCDQCHIHLGWYYVGPNEFAGLIRDRIVRASVVFS
jgi:hypothetical protein